jgi:hypothetical protein
LNEAHPPQTFQAEEVFTEHDELLVLSLGFASARDPLDVLHFACGRERIGIEPPLVEDQLYVERTDQDLACDGRDVLSLAGRGDHIEPVLSDEGMRLLGLTRCTHFRFDEHPELLPAALRQLTVMAQAGQANVSVQA